MLNVGTPLGTSITAVAPLLFSPQAVTGGLAGHAASQATDFRMDDQMARYHLMTSGPGGGSAGGASGLGGASAAGGAGSPPSSNDPKRFLDRTSTPDGELKLLEDAMAIDEEGVRWMEMVRRGIAGEASYADLIDRPLVKVVRRRTAGIMAPEPDNFKTEKDAPWGGTVIASEIKKGLGNWKPGLVIGESYEISGHPDYQNEFEFDYAGQRAAVDIGTLRTMFSKNLFGKRVAENEMTEMPFLVKLLNSGGWDHYSAELIAILSELDEREGADAWRKSVGVHASLMELGGRNYDEIHQGISKLEEVVTGDYPEMAHLERLHKDMLAKNLSVQVHPTSDYEGLGEGEHSKTEAWIIVGAEKGAGIYLGLKEGVTKDEFEKTLESGGDVTKYLNFIPVEAGDVFFIPAGTIHAIGAGVTLVEPQENSGTTYRVYDYGRLDKEGKPRKLDVKRAIAVTKWDGLRGEELVAALRREPKVRPMDLSAAAVVEDLVDERLFRTSRLTVGEGAAYEAKSEGVKGYTVLEGSVEVEADDGLSKSIEFLKGQSFIVPDATGRYTIRGTSQKSVLIETSEAGKA